jgi:hypothetical protein
MAVDNVVEKLVNMFVIVWPKEVSDARISKAIKANKKLYSIALPPASSLKNLISMPKGFYPVSGGASGSPLFILKITGLVSWHR